MKRHAHIAQEEKRWWHSHDDLEPLIGVPSATIGPVPLPDADPGAPEPGLSPAQEPHPAPEQRPD